MLKALLIVLLFAVAARAGDDLDLDETNFEETIKNNDYVLVMFYAPWCGHCKSFKPHFAAAATKAAGKYVLAKVDCTQNSGGTNNQQLCASHEVRGYPTVKFFKKGSVQEYTGPRDTDGVLAWLDKKTGPAAVTVASEDEVKAFVEENAGSAVVTGFFDSEGSDSHKEFIEAANDADMEDFKFVQAFGTSQKDGTITLHLKGETKTHPEGENIARWAFENSFPLVDEVGGHNFARYAKLGKPLHLVFVEPTDEKKDELVANLATVAAEHRDESFSWIDASKYAAQIKGMGASGDVVPCIIRLSSFGSDNKPVVFEEPLTLESLRDWAEGVKSGKYKYVPKSEPIPEENDGPVKVVVGKTWEQIVNDPSKNVLVEFYAPWCGHCKNLAPKYEELGTKFKDSGDVVIAKIDGTSNDVEAGVEIRGFPTLVFYSKTGKTTPLQYNGEREAAAMESWINEKKE